ncbi:MAG: cytochrome c biogenesis protein ResB [Micrococcales bacterium]|nr:cytochrome c biogenesis protein ResB [Micrococcales bacterium]MCL2667392.1 cytochrome c biogenesis protein ResB [Micrococcales bacterium]
MTVDITTPEATEPEEQDPARVSVWEMFRWVYRFFYSKTVGLVLILAMAVLVLIGTMGWLNFDVYRSPVFIGVAALLCLSIVACTAHRLPLLWKNWRHPRLVVPARAYESARYHAAVPMPNGSVTVMGTTVRDVLSKQRYRVLADPDHPKALYADRYSWGGFGAPVAHLSFVVIVIALVLSMTGGMDVMLTVPVRGEPVLVTDHEGEVWLEQTPSGYRYTDPAGAKGSLTVKALSYKAPLGDNDRPKDFVSRLVVMKNGKEIANQNVRVNSPLQAGGVRFHQADWEEGLMASVKGPDGVVFDGWAPLVVSGGKIADVSGDLVIADGPLLAAMVTVIAPSEPVKPDADSDGAPLADEGLVLVVAIPIPPTLNPTMTDPVTVQPDESLYSRSGPPEAPIVVKPGQALLRLYKGPEMIVDEQVVSTNDTWVYGDYTFTFGGAQASPVVRVRQDPGEPWMWAGAILLVIGITVTFAFRHRRMWVTWDDKSNQIRFASTDKRDTAWARRFRATVEAVAQEVDSSVETTPRPAGEKKASEKKTGEKKVGEEKASEEKAGEKVGEKKTGKKKQKDAGAPDVVDTADKDVSEGTKEKTDE